MRSAILVISLISATFACGGDDSGATAGGASDAGGSVADASGLDGSIAPGADAASDASTGPIETIHYLGRFDTSDPAGARFAWPGSAIITTFTGTGLDAKLVDQNQNYFDVVVDGAAPVTIMTQGTATYPLAKNLAAGTHTVVLTKITESFQGIVQLQSLTPTGGALVPTPFPYSRRIEMIGDSITCGYGVLGAGPSCGFTAATEDEDQAWGALAAAQLKAMHTAIAYSGMGIYRAYDGTTTGTMPLRWLRTFADDATSTWDTSKYAPDVVVINLGTNDFAKGDPGQPFVDAYTAFLTTLRKAYPRAYIVCVTGTLLGGASLTSAQAYVQGVVNARTSGGDLRVSYLDIAQQVASDGYGCDYHPSPKTQARMGSALAAHIHMLTGW